MGFRFPYKLALAGVLLVTICRTAHAIPPDCTAMQCNLQSDGSWQCICVA